MHPPEASRPNARTARGRITHCFGIAVLSTALGCTAAPRPKATEVLGPFAGFDAALHPDNVQPHRIAFYGTDLGWSYEHGGEIHFLFGDTHGAEKGGGISPTHDDSFGTIDLAEWPDPMRITAANLPRLKLGQDPGSSQAWAIDPGHPMEGLKTPVGGFSNGAREFGLFLTAKPQGCRVDADCSNGLTCDAGLGFLGERPERREGLTLPCSDTVQGCNADTLFDATGAPIQPSGLCSDRTSSIWADTAFGRVGAYGIRHLAGLRSTTDPRLYTDTRDWLTNKFTNVALRTVSDFVPEMGSGRAKQDYRSAGAAGEHRRVFLWGRPGFIGVNAKGSTLALYFAYVDMPGGPGFSWDVHFYTGTGADGVPSFSSEEREAAPVDLDASQAGVQPQEVHDIVQHMSIVWIEHLKKWVMFYGGGISKFPIPQWAPNCGVLEIFVRTDCSNVVVGNGAIRMRTADDPWGPWTRPQDLIVGGDPDERPLAGQYAPGGALHHPACTGDKCQAPSAQLQKGDYGWLYGANIIEEWIRPAGKGVDVIWNASTWDPYRVVLLRTRINP